MIYVHICILFNTSDHICVYTLTPQIKGQQITCSPSVQGQHHDVPSVPGQHHDVAWECGICCLSMILPGKVVYLSFELKILLSKVGLLAVINFCIAFIQRLVGLYCGFKLNIFMMQCPKGHCISSLI